MNDAEKARYALKDVVRMLRKLSDQHGSLRLVDPGWDVRLSYTLAREALTSLDKWIEDKGRLNSGQVTVLKSVN
jgi:hypothetical protein